MNDVNKDKGFTKVGVDIASMPDENALNLNQEHPDFTGIKEDYYKCGVFTKGGSAIEGKEAFLKRHAYETQKQYEIRLWLSKYRNHAKPIINVFNAAVWEQGPDREGLDPIFDSYIDDVDRQGTDANEFFNQVGRKASVKGISFVFIDHVELPETDAPKSKQEADNRELRPFFKILDAEQIIDWGFEEDKISGVQSLSYIVFKDQVEIESIPFRGREIQTQYKLWTKEKWETWILDEQKAKRIDNGDHKCGVVPVVPCFFEQDTPMTGLSAVRDIVGLCERIYRNGSCLDKSLYDTAFPLQLFLGFTKEQLASFTRSSSNGLVGETDCDSRFIEPAGRSFEELRLAIQSDENAIKELALRMIRPESKVAESAESKRLDKGQLNSKLTDFATNIENCEKKSWKIFGLWLGANDPKADIQYHKDFDEAEISVELIKLFADLAREQVLPNEDIVDALIRSGFLPEDYDKKQIMEKLKEQNRFDVNYPVDQESDAA